MNEELIEYLIEEYRKASINEVEAEDKNLPFTRVHEHAKQVMILRIFERYDLEDRLPRR